MENECRVHRSQVTENCKMVTGEWGLGKLGGLGNCL